MKNRHWSYLKYVARHKWFVWQASRRIGASPWLALVHDASKFRPSEWLPYARTFYGADGSGQYDETPAFNAAWLLHQHRNPHHWQHWLLRPDKAACRRFLLQEDGQAEGNTRLVDTLANNRCPIPALDLLRERENPGAYVCMLACLHHANADAGLVAMEMPRRYALEMVADWMGAGRAITGRWECAEWYERNRDSIVLHPATRQAVESIIANEASKAGGGTP